MALDAPYEDYRESHASRKEQGGVVNCLSHEIDLAYWLFGYPKTVYALGGHLSDLELNVEDTAEILLQCDWNSKSLPVHIHLDFIQSPPRRYINIVGEKGKMFLDLISNELTLSYKDTLSSSKILYKDFKRNDMFLQEMLEFIRCLHERKNPNIPIEDGENVLRICIDIIKSIEKNV